MSAAVDVTHLNGDIDEISTKAKAVAEKNGELRSLIKQKIDGRGYHKKALGMLRQINALSDEQLADFRQTFEDGYKEVIGRRDGQPDMFPANTPEELQPETASESEQPTEEPSGEFANDAYAAGMAAYEGGSTIEANPFDESDGTKRRLWEQGWNAAFDEDAEGDAESDLDEETVDQIGADMDADMERTENVVQPFTGGEDAA